MFQSSPTTAACRLALRKTSSFQRTIVLVTNSVWVVVGLLKRRGVIVKNTKAIWCMDWRGRRLAFFWQNWSVENRTSKLSWCGSGRSVSQEYQGHGDGLTVSSPFVSLSWRCCEFSVPLYSFYYLFPNELFHFLKSQYLLSYSWNCLLFMEHEGSLSHSQQPTTCPQPEPDRSSPISSIIISSDPI